MGSFTTKKTSNVIPPHYGVTGLSQYRRLLQKPGKKGLIQTLITDLENARKWKDLDEKATKPCDHDNKSQERRGFVAVLIDADGDDYFFKKQYLDRGHGGGRDAADAILKSVHAYLPALNLDKENVDIVVRCFANVEGLSRACVDLKAMEPDRHMAPFIQGFNQRQGLFDFVDVGSGKELADHKIRQNIDFFLRNTQCRHMILGILHDTGYKPFLNEIVADRSHEQRITLLQGGSNRTALHSLGFSRPLLKWSNVFAEKGRLAMTISPARSKTVASATPMDTGKLAEMKGNKDSPTLATESKIPLKVMANSSAPRKAKQAAKARPRPYVNPQPSVDRIQFERSKNGRKIDIPLSFEPVAPEVESIRAKKLCGDYYLKGYCNGLCKKKHQVPPLNEKDFDTLWHIYRCKTCKRSKKGYACEDSMCLKGHKKG